MENLLIIGFVFLCVLFAIVLTLQIAAERELKKKTRRLEELESRSADDSASNPPIRQEEIPFPGTEQESAKIKEKDPAPQLQMGLGKDQISRTEEPAAPEAIGEGNPLRKRSYAVLSGATVVLFSAAILTAGFWRDDSDKGSDKVTVLPVEKPQAAIPDKKGASTSKPTALTRTVKPVEESRESSLTGPSKFLTAKFADRTSKNQPASATPKRRESPGRKSQDNANTPRPTWARYKILSSTPVFSEPSEKSDIVASAATGMQVNVVGSQGDWLEIRSRYGRPPGFIKKSAAAPASQH